MYIQAEKNRTAKRQFRYLIITMFISSYRYPEIYNLVFLTAKWPNRQELLVLLQRQPVLLLLLRHQRRAARKRQPAGAAGGIRPRRARDKRRKRDPVRGPHVYEIHLRGQRR